MSATENDACYVVAVHSDGTVIARQVSPLADELGGGRRSVVTYRGDAAPDRVAAARDAITLLVVGDERARQADVLELPGLASGDT